MADNIDKPRPIELCLERVAASASADRYVRCTAQVGRALGLGLGCDGRIRWCEQSGVGCEIWVSADQRLMAYCPTGSPPTTLYRLGRVLELPREHPVVLRHHDELELAGTRFRVHVHGVTDRVHAPTIVRTLARAAATVTLALGVGGGVACDNALNHAPDAPLEVLDQPPAIDPNTLSDAGVVPMDSGEADPRGIDGGGIDGEEPADAAIEVLDFPPVIP